MDVMNLEESIKEAELVITGEGCLDGQSIMGKGPIQVAQLGKKYGKKVVAFAGCIGEDANLCHDYGIDAYFPIIQKAMSLDHAMDPRIARNNLMSTVMQVMRILSD